MSGAPDILIIDSNVSDSKLCQLVLARTFKDAAISIANDAPAFAEVLSSQRLDVAIVSPKIAWDDRNALIHNYSAGPLLPASLRLLKSDSSLTCALTPGITQYLGDKTRSGCQ